MEQQLKTNGAVEQYERLSSSQDKRPAFILTPSWCEHAWDGLADLVMERRRKRQRLVGLQAHKIQVDISRGSARQCAKVLGSRYAKVDVSHSIFGPEPSWTSCEHSCKKNVNQTAGYTSLVVSFQSWENRGQILDRQIFKLARAARPLLMRFRRLS